MDGWISFYCFHVFKILQWREDFLVSLLRYFYVIV